MAELTTSTDPILYPDQATLVTEIRTAPERMAQALVSPLSCDFTHDPLACAILEAWARQPWQEAHRAALVDHLLDSGRNEEELRWLRSPPAKYWWEIAGKWPRRARQAAIKRWKVLLIEHFGDFTSP